MDRRGAAAPARNARDLRGPARVPAGSPRDPPALIQVLFRTLHHFFGPIAPLFRGVTDPRAPQRITYPLAALTFAGVLLFLCRIGARRQVGLLLRTEAGARSFQTLFGVDAVPHGDTLARTFRLLDPAQLQTVVTGLTTTLIRRTVLDGGRLLERFFVVAIDGTGTLTYHTRHCDHCLTRTQQGRTLYYHCVLEATRVTPTGFAWSVMSEFIENPGPHPTKQDCELRAFYRLAAQLKAQCPRLPLVLSLDGLYACGPVFAQCRQYGWSDMIVLKDADLPSVHEEAAALQPLQPANRLVWSPAGPHSIRQVFRWGDALTYADTARRVHTLSVLECQETRADAQGTPKTTTFKWVTDRSLTAQTVVALAQEGGRLRWKVENEGFNVQKTGGYGLEHGYCDDVTAAKVFYYLLQIAHLLAQLVEKGSLLRRAFPTGLGSAKNTAWCVLEAWRAEGLDRDSLRRIEQGRFQIRFDSS
jgi:hypothetical protein